METPRQVADSELVASYTRLISVNGETHLQCGLVRWDRGPHAPRAEWTTVHRWKRPPTVARLTAAQQKVLANPRFFVMCRRCGERHNRGHMHDRSICQSCAERHLGVVC